MVFVWLFLVIRRPPAPPTSDAVVLRYGGLLRMLAWLSALGIPALLIWVMAYLPLRPPNGVMVVGAGMLVFGVIGGLLLIETSRVRIIITDEGIHGFSPWRGERVIPWKQV